MKPKTKCAVLILSIALSANVIAMVSSGTSSNKMSANYQILALQKSNYYSGVDPAPPPPFPPPHSH